MSSNREVFLILLALLVPVAGCGETVLGGGTGGGGQGGGTTSPALTKEFVTRFGSMPAWPSDLSGPGMSDPDTLVLVWGTRAESCASPFVDQTLTTGFDEEAILLIPPDLVHPGPLDVTDPRVQYFSFEAQPGGPGGGGGALVPPGTPPPQIEIVSVDATSVTINFVTSVPFYLVYPPAQLQGVYRLPRC